MNSCFRQTNPLHNLTSSHKTGSPGAAHLSLDWRHWLAFEQPGGTKKTWRLGPTFQASFRTIKRGGAPTVRLLPHHLPLLLCLFSDSLLLLQRGRAGWLECTIPPVRGSSFWCVKGSGFSRASWLPCWFFINGLAWGGGEVSAGGGGFRGGEQHFKTQLIRAVVFCNRGRHNVFLTRGKRGTAAWIVDGYLTKKRSAEGICLPSIKTWERCESCWQGGNLKKKLTEKDLSGSRIHPFGPSIWQEAISPGGMSWLSPVSWAKWTWTAVRGGEEEQNEEGLETSEENGGGEEEKEEERSQGYRQVWSPETGNTVNWRKRFTLVWIYLHPTADKTKLYKDMCSGESVHPFFYRTRVCCGCGLNYVSVGFFSLRATLLLYVKVSWWHINVTLLYHSVHHLLIFVLYVCFLCLSADIPPVTFISDGMLMLLKRSHPISFSFIVIKSSVIA